jgi:hypothetical protein
LAELDAELERELDLERSRQVSQERVRESIICCQCEVDPFVRTLSQLTLYARSSRTQIIEQTASDVAESLTMDVMNAAAIGATQNSADEPPSPPRRESSQPVRRIVSRRGRRKRKEVMLAAKVRRDETLYRRSAHPREILTHALC